MKTGIKTLLFSAVLPALAFPPSVANACAVCMGGSDSTVAPAANGAIFFMLGTVGVMLACVAGFIFHLARRARLSAPVELPGALKIIPEEEQHA